MTWTEPPAPSHGIPGAEPGRPLTPDHPAWHRRHDESVWGTLAGHGVHNPFHDALQEPAGDWGNGSNQRFWEHLRQTDPDKLHEARRSFRGALSGHQLAMAVPGHALHKILDEGRVRSFFENDPQTHWAGSPAQYAANRTGAEHTHFGYPADHPPSARPVYGYLTRQPFTSTEWSGYGNHTLVLSRPALAHRTTWLHGDSLNDLPYSRASALNDPRLHSVMPNHLVPGNHDAGVHEVLHHRAFQLEAQYHGGVHLGHIHYAILRSPRFFDDEYKQGHQAAVELSHRLSEHGIPWVHTVDFTEPDDPVIEGMAGRLGHPGATWSHGRDPR